MYFANAFALISLLGMVCMHFSISASAQPLQRFEFEENLMGTMFRVVLYAQARPWAQSAAGAAFARIAALDQVMSDYREDSELRRLCLKAGEGPVPISADLFQVLRESQRWSKLTEGAFDCTVGPLTQLWRRSRRQRELPSPERLAQALNTTGFEKLILDPRRRTAQLLCRGMRLDLGAIGKGFAADEALRLLKKMGANRALVVAGGEMAASAPPPGKQGWKILIAPLNSSSLESREFLLLKHAAVSTSGDAEQFVEIEGQRFSHILDPKTGLGLKGRRSVSVIAPRGAISDALATALNVMGREKGFGLIESLPGLAAFYMEDTEMGVLRAASKRWDRFKAAPNLKD
jgi:FAD:protein FMN transferase